MFKFALTFALCLLPSLAMAQTPATKIDSLDIVKVGVMKVESKPTTTKSNDISTGMRVDYKEDPHVVTETRTIKVEDEMVFGLEAKLNGSPKGRNIKVKIIWTYPEPGIKHPTSGKITLRDEIQGSHKIGGTESYFWTIGNDYTLVPGVWTVEIFDGTRRLAKQEFTITR